MHAAIPHLTSLWRFFRVDQQTREQTTICCKLVVDLIFMEPLLLQWQPCLQLEDPLVPGYRNHAGPSCNLFEYIRIFICVEIFRNVTLCSGAWIPQSCWSPLRVSLAGCSTFSRPIYVQTSLHVIVHKKRWLKQGRQSEIRYMSWSTLG